MGRGEFKGSEKERPRGMRLHLYNNLKSRSLAVIGAPTKLASEQVAPASQHTPSQPKNPRVEPAVVRGDDPNPLTPRATSPLRLQLLLGRPHGQAGGRGPIPPSSEAPSH